MLPWQELERAAIPGEAQPMVLLRRGHEYVIRVGAVALMASTAHGSEEALADLACAALAGRAAVRVLVGGLGMGFTLAAVLRALPADGHVTVAELVPAVVEWNRGALAPLAGRPLDDARVTVHLGDVAAAYGAAGTWDAILLDVDNGPGGFTRGGNDALYSADGLAAAHAALAPGGVLAVWSVAPDDAFTHRLRRAGFVPEERTVRARAARGGRHTLWIATRRARA